MERTCCISTCDDNDDDEGDSDGYSEDDAACRIMIRCTWSQSDDLSDEGRG